MLEAIKERESTIWDIESEIKGIGSLYEKYADTVIEEQGDAEDVVVRILNRISGREP